MAISKDSVKQRSIDVKGRYIHDLHGRLYPMMGRGQHWVTNTTGAAGGT